MSYTKEIEIKLFFALFISSVSDHVTSAAELSKNEEEGEETLYEWMKKQALEKIDDPILDGDEDEIMTIKIQESLNNEGDIIKYAFFTNLFITFFLVSMIFFINILNFSVKTIRLHKPNRCIFWMLTLFSNRCSPAWV